jgi:tRNA nucleotidyltransferase (CCA-adding enzyme)
MLSIEQLRRKIIEDKYNSVIFAKGRGREIYLVGGYVRDALMGIRSSDRDYIVSGDLKSFVCEIRGIIKGTIVEFRKQNMMRIALKEGLTFDFSKQVGVIREDLSRRDFTINAIAWSPRSGIIDYFNGVRDVKKKRIRAISEQNIISDPLRMIRAYRFAAEMNGSIENGTRMIIKRLHDRIKDVSSERITLELFNLLNSANSYRYLKMALEDRVLTGILLFPFKKLENNIREISKLEKTYIKKPSRKIKVLLDENFAENLVYKGLLCLETLLQNRIGSHREAEKLKMSNKINRRIELAHKGIKELAMKKSILRDKLFSVFMKSKEASLDLLIMINRPDLAREYNRFKKIWKDGFLSSEEIINFSNQIGPGIAKIIEELKRAQFERKIKSKKQAIEFLYSLVS